MFWWNKISLKRLMCSRQVKTWSETSQHTHTREGSPISKTKCVMDVSLTSEVSFELLQERLGLDTR